MERPCKKRRLPDGFQKSRYRQPERTFVSAFNSPAKTTKSPPVTRSSDVPEAGPSKVLPPLKLLKPPVFLPTASNETAAPSSRQPILKPPPVPSEKHKPPERTFVSAFDTRNSDVPEAGPSKADGFQKSRYKPPERTFVSTFDTRISDVQPPLKLLKPPVFLPTSSNETATPSSLQPMLKPPVPSEKPKSVLKPPPVPVPASNKSSVPKKSLPPPPVPEQRHTSPKKPMKTILTTTIAQATDPTKEGSGAELLSLFLQQHGHNFVSSTDRELQRGVMVSPDKRSRGKDPRFVRGGLAERLQHRISCTKTDFVLWRRQMEQKMESGTKFGSDMQLRIMRVLDMTETSERSRFTPGPRAGLALCRLTRRHALTSGDLTLGTYVVVFHFGPTNGGRSAVSSAERFQEGNDVLVWLPWQKVELVGAQGCAELLEMFQTLDALTPPHSLLVVSRFCIVVPKPS